MRLSQAGKRLGIFAITGLFFLTAACATASDTTDTSGNATTATSTASTTAVPPTTTGSTDPDTSAPNDGPGESVVIRSTQSSFKRGESVVFVVSNGLAQSITAQDQRGFCTIVYVDRLEGEEWEQVAPCISGPPPIDVVISAGSEMTAELRQPLEPGTYRGRLVYSVGDVYLVEQTLELVGNTFVAE